MSQPQKPKKHLECAKTLLEDGQTTASFNVSKLQEDIDCMISQDTLKTKTKKSTQGIKKDNLSATVGSPHKVKKTICKDKSNTCKKNSQNISLSQTSDQGSTSTEKVFDPLLNWLPKEKSKRLWLPTEIDCAALHSNWFNGSFKSIKSKSWFSIKKWIPQKKQNWQKTSLQSSMFSIAELMEGENIKTKTRTNKIRKTSKNPSNMYRRYGLKPNPEVANTLRKWFGSVRHTYNWVLSCIKLKPKQYKKTDMIWLRKRFINSCNIPKSKKFLLDTPKSLRDSAIIDLANAYKSNFTVQKKDPSHTFELKFRKKSDSQSLTITSEQIKNWDNKNNEFNMFPTFLKNKIKFNARKMATASVDYDCKLLMDRLGKFSLVIVYHVPPCENQTGTKEKWCSIDTGVRTFGTVYSPTPGLCYKIGDKDISRIYRLCKGLDKLISKKRNSNNSKLNKKRKKEAIIRARSRIRNLVTEVHCKTIDFLLKKFNRIIIPPFESSHMVKRTNRKIRTKTVRQMLCWRHYAFKERIKQVAARFTNVEIYERPEHYTSKTCTECRNIKHNLGGAKIYKCQCCNLKVDRDVNGARNIFIKNCVIKNG